VEIAVPIVIGIVLLLVVVVAVLATATRGINERKEVIEDPDVETLTYRMPPGQDPATVVAALQHEGFTANADPVSGGHDVVVACVEGRNAQRAQVRSIIAGTGSGDEAPSSVEVPPVRFADEQH
jgi:hypothetical protein